MELEYSIQSIVDFLKNVIKRTDVVPQLHVLAEVRKEVEIAEQKALNNLADWANFYREHRFQEEDIQSFIKTKEAKVQEISRAVAKLAYFAVKTLIINPQYSKVKQHDRRIAFRHQANLNVFFKQHYIWDEALLHNLSRTGAMISTLKQVKPDEPIIINLIHKENSMNEQIPAKVVWQTIDNKIGVHFYHQLPGAPNQYI